MDEKIAVDPINPGPDPKPAVTATVPRPFVVVYEALDCPYCASADTALFYDRHTSRAMQLCSRCKEISGIATRLEPFKT